MQPISIFSVDDALFAQRHLQAAWQFCLLVIMLGFVCLPVAQANINPKSILPAHQAYQTQVFATENGVSVQFDIAKGYYLYQQKIAVHSTGPHLKPPEFSPTTTKTDEFFGTQPVYYQVAQINIPFQDAYDMSQPYQLVVEYQGCADVGVCYPPSKAVFDINQVGVITPTSTDKTNVFTQSQPNFNFNTTNASNTHNERFQLNDNQLWQSLLTFFIAGIGLSLTACMYPLLPIVSSIVVGQKRSRRIAFGLSFLYVQGLAVTYALVGVITALTGALLMAWLQQAWVILSAALVLVVLALAMFDVIQIQLPSRLQSYFQQTSSRFSGGKIVSVFFMGMLSALIVGPCVAPPLAFALGYIAQSGNAFVGGAALYAMALGTGLPLILVATFGAHILPKAGTWMNGVKVIFGCLLLMAAVYLARPFLPFWLNVSLYGAILFGLGLYWVIQSHQVIPKWRYLPLILGASLIAISAYFTGETIRGKVTPIHQFLSLQAPNQAHFGKQFTDVSLLQDAVATALQQDPSKPVIVDFYADWCVTCIQMQMNTFNTDTVKHSIDEQRFFTIDVTANTPEHQALLKEYGLFGPPGIFKIHANGSKSEPVLGFVSADEFVKWAHAKP
ncbi:protein-disulfide reductase DsbD [Vitreoscilla stercoraria]|uniref:Protein-disulfide reductase DsbD n=2 Tax=Vitreoscilla stercoraria TaxID=61 RepID=A0ABY4ECU4_VITST|nr:protein-disulfide reductase DsbD [Vitreoscilla stercoraria]UOO93111.1 protein-disulfide reductase DsbD [Vitreoscilla stercoraria]